MLYEVIYPFLYVMAKSQQFAVRTRSELGFAPRASYRVTYKPETRYRILCWSIRKLDIELSMRIAPNHAARIAIKRFETTKRDPRAPIKLSHQDQFKTRYLVHDGLRIRLFDYGPEDGPKIVALHGWNGKASMLHLMNLALAEAGFRVFAPDLPGHGGSEGNRHSFHDLGKAVAEMFGDQGKLAAVIGHSGGGLIASIALAEGLPTKIYIPIGAPSSLYSLLKSYVEVSQMPEKTIDYIARYYNRRYRTPLEELGSRGLSNLDIETLVIHDLTDWMVGVDNAHEWATCAAKSELLLTQEYTHLSIVKQPIIHERMLSFIRAAYQNV